MPTSSTGVSVYILTRIILHRKPDVATMSLSSEQKWDNTVTCLMRPLLPILPELPLHQLVLRPSSIEQPRSHPRQMRHDRRGDNLPDPCTSQSRLREERAAAQEQREVPGDLEEHPRITRMAHDAVGSQGYELVIVPRPNLPREETSQRPVAPPPDRPSTDAEETCDYGSGGESER